MARPGGKMENERHAVKEDPDLSSAHTKKRVAAGCFSPLGVIPSLPTDLRSMDKI